MIGKVMKNNSFRATAGYVLGKAGAQIIGGNMAARTTDDLVAEFLFSKSLNYELERPVLHIALSFSHADKATEKLTPRLKQAIAMRHFAGMVLSSREPRLLDADNRSLFRRRVNAFLAHEIAHYQVCVVEHHDAEHAHVHIVASRINLRDGKCIHAWRDRLRNKDICRDLEQQFGLEAVPNNWWDVVRPTADERQRILTAAPLMAQQLDSPNSTNVPAGYSLVRQGRTIIYRRPDGAIALRARQNKQHRWIASAGNLTQEEWQQWQPQRTPQQPLEQPAHSTNAPQAQVKQSVPEQRSVKEPIVEQVVKPTPEPQRTPQQPLEQPVHSTTAPQVEQPVPEQRSVKKPIVEQMVEPTSDALLEKQRYKQLYEHFWQMAQVQLKQLGYVPPHEPAERDQTVAIMVIQDQQRAGQSKATAMDLAMRVLGQGDQAQQLLNIQGESQAIEYIYRTVLQALKPLQKQDKRQKQAKTQDMER